MLLIHKVQWHLSIQGRWQYLSIALSILQQAEEELATLRRPSTLTVALALVLGLGRSTHATTETAEGDDPLVSQNVLQVLLGLAKLHVPQSKG